MRRIVSYLLVLLCLGGCNDGVNEKIVGVYSITELQYIDHYVEDELSTNVLSFNDDGTCMFPGMRGRQAQATSALRKGSWEVNESDTTLQIASEYWHFQGTYSIEFKLNPTEKLLELVLRSDSVYLRASKGLQNYDAEKGNWVQ